MLRSISLLLASLLVVSFTTSCGKKNEPVPNAAVTTRPPANQQQPQRPNSQTQQTQVDFYKQLLGSSVRTATRQPVFANVRLVGNAQEQISRLLTGSPQHQQPDRTFHQFVEPTCIQSVQVNVETTGGYRYSRWYLEFQNKSCPDNGALQTDQSSIKIVLRDDRPANLLASPRTPRLVENGRTAATYSWEEDEWGTVTKMEMSELCTGPHATHCELKLAASPARAWESIRVR